MTTGTAVPFALERLGVIMEGDPYNPDEAWGVLNPACCRGRDGTLYLYPRVVAEGNRSRIGIARVLFEHDEPVGVERMRYVLEPTAGFERNERTAGVEDPRITFIDAIDSYVMTYTAYSPVGPRIALAISDDALTWRRLGPVHFGYDDHYHTCFNLFANKDALIFPEPVRDPHGNLAFAMLHRPDFHADWRCSAGISFQPRGVAEERPSMWISYVPLKHVLANPRHLCQWYEHHVLAEPKYAWEALKIGGGTPPVLTPFGWLVIYHGVKGKLKPGVDHQHNVYYSAGVMILDRDEPHKVLYRSAEPILTPDTEGEQHGIVDNVVFPTGVDVRGHGRIDVYYGMADARIGVAKMYLPDTLPV